MRRLAAIALLLLFGFTLIGPLLDVSSSSTLPACCRRDGRHHCMGMMMNAPGSNGSVAFVASRCPRFPVASVAPQLHSFLSKQPAKVGTLLYVQPDALPQTEARYRVSYARSRQKRGPPALLS